MITMTYFHPWTMHKEAGSCYVPYLGDLKPQGVSWDEALTTWLDGYVVSKEAAQYVGNFLSVYRVRPGNDEDDTDVNSDDDVDDEALELKGDDDLAEALRTRVRPSLDGDLMAEGAIEDVDGDLTLSGMHFAQSVWKSKEEDFQGKDTKKSGEATKLVPRLETILKSAQASKKKEIKAAVQAKNVREPNLTMHLMP